MYEYLLFFFFNRIVEEVGKEVKTLKPGDAVYTYLAITGTYAQYALFDENTAFRYNPNKVTFEEASG